MTWEELMDSIDNWDCAGMVDEPAVKALRVVVDLHKPKEFEFNDRPVFVCGHCQLGVVGDEYPCETIQAIEKVLDDN
jgi:hypothetical protein